jgi:hypothetical protein
MADNLYVPQVDYTSRDFVSISSDMKSLISNFAPQWTSRDSSDFGIVLIELFAYMGDILNYNIDRAANESFISTATQRDTVLRLANLLNYTPNDINPATGSVTLSNRATTAVTVKSGSIFATEQDGTGNQITFSLDNDVTIPGMVGTTISTNSGTVTQGQVVTDEVVGVSNGLPYQVFTLSNPGVITGGNVIVKVNNVTYNKVPYVIDYGSQSPVFSIATNGAGFSVVEFGDGTSGRIPPTGSIIKVTYRYTDTAGSLGNISAGVLTRVVSDPSGVPISDLTVTNPVAFSGGKDAESTDAIRVNAPLALRTLNRAVSLKDYAQLAVQINGVSKAIASAAVYTNVTLYIAASGGGALSNSLKTTIENYFVDKMPPNTTLTVLDYRKAYPYLDVTVNVLPQYTASVVAAEVADALYSLFDFENVVFNDLVAVGDIHSACRSVDGVSYITINNYEKQLAVITSPILIGGVTDLSCDLDEIPTLEKTYIKVATTGGVS